MALNNAKLNLLWCTIIWCNVKTTPQKKDTTDHRDTRDKAHLPPTVYGVLQTNFPPRSHHYVVVMVISLGGDLCRGAGELEGSE